MDSEELDKRKTLQTVVKIADENDEFAKQRTAAIAEVAKGKEVGQFLIGCIDRLVVDDKILCRSRGQQSGTSFVRQTGFSTQHY